MEKWRKKKVRIKINVPNLFALMLHYLSDESLKNIQRQPEWDNVQREHDLELCKCIEKTHFFHYKPICKIYLPTHKTTYNESIITHKERFNSVLKACMEQGNPAFLDEDTAINFFSGLHMQGMPFSRLKS